MAFTILLLMSGESCLLPETGMSYAAELLVVGIPESSPPEYISEDASAATGFAMEFIENVAEDAGYSIMIRRFPDWQTVLHELDQGRVHIVPLMTVTEEHSKVAHFSAPVTSYSIGMFTRSGSTDLRGIEDMQGRKVAVVSGDLGYAIARELHGVLIREAANVEQLLVMLLSNQVDAIIYSTAAIQYVATGAGVQSRIAVLDDSLLRLSQAVAVTPKRDDVYKRLNEQVHKFVGSRAFDTLHDKWYAREAFLRTGYTFFWKWMAIAGTMFVAVLLALLVLRRRGGDTRHVAFNALLEGIGSAAVLVSSEELLIGCNSQATSLFGVSGGASGIRFSDLFSGDEKVRKGTALWRVIETGDPVESMHEAHGKLFRVSMLPVVLSSKQPPYVLVMLRDVTDRNILETLIQEAQRNFELIFEKSPEGIAILHNNMTFSSVNSALARLLGYSQEELIAKTLRDVMHPDDAEEARLELHMVFAGDANSVRMERRFLHRNGIPVWASLTISVQRSEQGLITGIYAHIHDVHERKMSEQRLRESEQRYREIFERASDLILLVNLSNGRIEEFNQAVVDSLGYSISELSSLNIADLECCSSDLFGAHYSTPIGQRGYNIQGSFHCLVHTAESPDHPSSETPNELCETRLRKHDGSYLDVQVHTKMLAASGRQYALSVLRDISGIKAIESKLLQAEQVEEQVARTRDDFFANISPELRTPLQGILGMMQLMGQTQLNPVQQEYVRLARETGNSLMRFMDDLIDFTGFEHEASLRGEPHWQNKPGPFLVDELFNTIITSFTCEATLNGATLGAVIDSEIPEMIVGAAQRIRQILFNLVGYTLHYARGGHVRIALRQPREGAMEAENGMRMTEFAVSLDSDPMEAWLENLKCAFEGNSKDIFGNSRTFGLMVSKRLAGQIQGSIYVDSGSGDMEIVLRVPLRWVPRKIDKSLFRTLVAEAAARAEESLSMEGQDHTAHVQPHAGREAGDIAPKQQAVLHAENASLAGIRVIVADDDSINRMVVGRWFEIHGGAVTFADNGREVLDLLGTESFDCVVMDLQMPEMGGLEATAAIRTGNAGNAVVDIPILAVTAFALEENRKACDEAGMNGFFSKPIDLSELSSSIMRLVVPNQRQDISEAANQELIM